MVKTNKVVYNGTTLVDLTADTVVESKVASGVVFHKADGTTAEGTAQLTYNSTTEELTMPDWSVVING